MNVTLSAEIPNVLVPAGLNRPLERALVITTCSDSLLGMEGLGESAPEQANHESLASQHLGCSYLLVTVVCPRFLRPRRSSMWVG